VILGAGFSRAINAHLPLANELGQAAYERAQTAAPDLFDGQPTFSSGYPFESWLSLLAEDQPHLDEGENRLNTARFAKLTQSIVDVLDELQTAALTEAGPPWLYDLLSAFHHRETTVVTLNYDTLIESAVNGTYLGLPEIEGGPPRGFEDFSTGTFTPIAQQVSPGDVLGTQPPLLATSRSSPPPTMRLLKLHGSLGWWWVPNDASGATIARGEVLSTFGNPVAMTDEQRRSLPGREPFIVPPLATKSPYYRNPLTRQLWRDAFAAISTADRVSFIGYSIPPMDLVMAGVLDGALRGRQVNLDVVDLEPKGVVARLESLIGPNAEAHRCSEFAGEGAVANFARALCEATGREVPPALAALTLRADQSRREMAIVTWSKDGSAVNHRVVATEESSRTLRLTTDPWVNYGSEPFEDDPTTLDLLRRAGNVDRIVARTQEGPERVIVGFNAPHFDNPNAHHVLYLMPAGQL
jgi:hypothetical protein